MANITEVHEIYVVVCPGVGSRVHVNIHFHVHAQILPYLLNRQILTVISALLTDNFQQCYRSGLVLPVLDPNSKNRQDPTSKNRPDQAGIPSKNWIQIRLFKMYHPFVSTPFLYIVTQKYFA
jgi:hypothetical protein